MKLAGIAGAAALVLAGCVVAPPPEPAYPPPPGRDMGPGHRGPHGDRDRDGVPNRYDRDRDNDGVPDRYDRRPNDPYRR